MTCSHGKAAEFAGTGGRRSQTNFKVRVTFRLPREVLGVRPVWRLFLENPVVGVLIETFVKPFLWIGFPFLSKEHLIGAL